MSDSPWLQSLIWMDYRLMVIFAGIIPIVLIIWAFVQKAEAIQRLLIIYWRVVSLSAITIYLMIPALPISFASGCLARILTPISLWFWLDLNEEISDRPLSPLKLTFTSWRWAITLYSLFGLLLQIPALGCAFLTATDIKNTPSCRYWLEPHWLYKEIFHANSTVGFLGFLGIVGLIIYMFVFGYFVLIRLSKQGRSATGV